LSAKIDLEGPARTIAEVASGNWIVRNVYWHKSFIRIILGVVWLVDGSLKFQPGFVDSFPDLIKSAGQPAWLQPWFNFWYNATVGNAAPFVYGIALLEVSLGVALVLGLVRKLAYIGGLILSLLIWAISGRFWGTLRTGVDRHRNRNRVQFRFPISDHHQRYVRHEQIFSGLSYRT